MGFVLYLRSSWVLCCIHLTVPWFNLSQHGMTDLLKLNARGEDQEVNHLKVNHLEKALFVSLVSSEWHYSYSAQPYGSLPKKWRLKWEGGENSLQSARSLSCSFKVHLCTKINHISSLRDACLSQSSAGASICYSVTATSSLFPWLVCNSDVCQDKSSYALGTPCK